LASFLLAVTTIDTGDSFLVALGDRRWKDSTRIRISDDVFLYETNDDCVGRESGFLEDGTVGDTSAPHPGALSSSAQRRKLLSTTALAFSAATIWSVPENAAAAPMLPSLIDFDAVVNRPSQPSRLYKLAPKRNTTSSQVSTPLVDAQLPAFNELSSELCLLRLLPVKNPFFRELQTAIEGLSTLRSGVSPDRSADAWAQATRNAKDCVEQIDKKRTLLQPVFKPEEDTLMQISKGERFEILIETLRSRLIDVANATARVNSTDTFIQQKAALLTLSEIGELLVTKFPYEVPTVGKYSYLPRLMGRCKVILTFRRKKTSLGNVTIVADGFTAPLTAGNFVDLCARGFYTGLPIRFTKKRLGSGSVFEVANIPIMGSYNEGFYDPLTAKLRRLPLELLRLTKSSGELDLTYSQGLSSLTESTQAVLEPTANSRPLLSFKIPGLVAMNHPDKNPNGASSEFFSLQSDSMLEEKRGLLDGEYAPFGYIISGRDVFEKLQPNDVIEATKVSEFGIQNLIKLRRSSFQEVVQGSGKEQEQPE